MDSDEIIWEGSESANRFYRRVESFLDELIKLAEDQNILLVAHGGVSIPFYCHFHGYEFRRFADSVMIETVKSELPSMERQNAFL